VFEVRRKTPQVSSSELFMQFQRSFVCFMVEASCLYGGSAVLTGG
jgi:hypothetical protein